jgi:predicted cupin superfamily sugar epimerase
MIKLKDLLVEKRLRVLDFDDTLVKTKSFIYITHKDGSKSKLTPGEYAVYDERAGDEFDFKDFELASRSQLISEFPNLKSIITDFTRG